ncbi:Rv3235 family protein [Rhodococcus aetherivorans]
MTGDSVLSRGPHTGRRPFRADVAPLDPGELMTSPHGDAHYVRRIVPFEPPVQRCCPAGPHRRHARRRLTPHDGRSVRASAPPAGRPLPEVDPAARRFADLAARLILEVADRRRPETQLAAVLHSSLHATVAAVAKSGDTGTAVLLRTRLRAVDADTAELFGSYGRGHRVFALAGRVSRHPTTRRTPHGWLITTVWLG